MSAPYKRPIREDSASYELTGIPCGDPRRFTSRGTIRMAPSPSPYKSQRLDVPVEEIETEGERQLRQLAKKQMQTTLSLHDLHKEKRSFSTGHVQKPMDVSGALSLSSYQTVTDRHETEDALRHIGLSEEQIAIKVAAERDGPEKSTKPGYGIDPEVQRAQLQAIDKQIVSHQEQLSKPDAFSHAHYMTRQARDLEAAITQGDDKARLLSRLITDQRPVGELEDPDHPINKLGDIWDDMRADWKKNRKKGKEKVQSEEKDETIVSSDGDIATCATRDEAELWRKDSGETVDSMFDDSEAIQEASQAECPELEGSEQDNHERDSCGRGMWEPCEPPIVKQWPPPLTKDLQKLVALASVSDPEGEKKRAVRQARYLVKPVAKEDIIAGRLTPDKLSQQLSRYKDFSPGEPTETLYVQNLPSCSEEELFALFLHFQKPESPDINIRKMTGRMKGQAFITLDSPETASAALELLNGYMFKEKPMLIKYGRQKK